MTKIEWTEQTWNPIVGCTIVSPGCTNCYAMRMAARIEAMDEAAYRKQVEQAVEVAVDRDHEERIRADMNNGRVPTHYAGTTKSSKAGAVWTGKVALAPEHILTEPLRRRKPTMYFVNSMSDLFHEDVPDWWIYLALAAMALTYDASEYNENRVVIERRPRHVYQVLTKRSARMKAFMTALHAASDYKANAEWLQHHFSEAARRMSQAAGHPYWMNAPLVAWQWVTAGCPGLWLGVSAERQQEADARIPDLLATPAAVRFVSAEPLLGPVDFTHIDVPSYGNLNALDDGYFVDGRPPRRRLDWIIVGGESGPGARPMHPDWARNIRDQCTAAGVPFFFKQWGQWLVGERPQGDSIAQRVFQDGDDFMVVSDGHDIALGAAEDEKNGPRRIWSKYGGWQGNLVKYVREKSACRLLDGREWNEMPGTQADEVAA